LFFAVYYRYSLETIKSGAIKCDLSNLKTSKGIGHQLFFKKMIDTILINFTNTIGASYFDFFFVFFLTILLVLIFVDRFR